jgi:excisionase family DNA binding protein
MANSLPEMLTVAMVADLLSVSVRTVWRMVENGNLPAPVRLNRKWVRWPTADILAAVERMRKDAGY